MNLQGQSRELIPFAVSVQETCGLLEEDGMLMQCSVLFYSDLYDLVKCASGQQHERITPKHQVQGASLGRLSTLLTNLNKRSFTQMLYYIMEKQNVFVLYTPGFGLGQSIQTQEIS